MIFFSPEMDSTGGKTIGTRDLGIFIVYLRGITALKVQGNGELVHFEGESSNLMRLILF